MFDKLGLIEKRYEELEQMIAQPEIATDPKQLQELLQERANLKNIVTQYQQYKTCLLYTSPSPRDRTRSRMPSSA